MVPYEGVRNDSVGFWLKNDQFFYYNIAALRWYLGAPWGYLGGLVKSMLVGMRKNKAFCLFFPVKIRSLTKPIEGFKKNETISTQIYLGPCEIFLFFWGAFWYFLFFSSKHNKIESRL